MKHPDLLLSRIGLALTEALPRRDGGHVVLITSAAPREGKSFVARQLAHELAQTIDGTVALISTAVGADDADTAEGATRVRHVTASDAALDDSVFRSAGVVRAFTALQQRFALSVVDGPALVACGAMLRHADAVVLVVDSRHTSPHAIRREIARAGIESARLAGVVLNRVVRGLPAWMGGD